MHLNAKRNFNRGFQRKRSMKWTRNNILKISGIAISGIVVGQFLLAPPHTQNSITKSEHVKSIETDKSFAAIIDNAGERLMVFDLYADWCGPCRILHPTIEALADKYNGKADFYRINVDAHPDIAAAFGTQGIPFVVFVKKGKAISSFAGVNPYASYEKVISACASAESEACDKSLNSL
jgi:thioredoxin